VLLDLGAEVGDQVLRLDREQHDQRVGGDRLERDS
jgi:hypothetical protein